MATNPWRTLLGQPTIAAEALRATYCEALAESDLIAALMPMADHPLRIGIQLQQGRAFVISLEELMADLGGAPVAEREEIVQRHLAGSFEMASAQADSSAAPEREQLIPLIKSSDWLASLPTPDLVTAPLVADLHIVYAFDLENSMTYARRHHLDALALASEELLPLALANLRKRLPPLRRQGDGTSFIFVAGGAYEASLILLDSLWERLATELPGELVACVLSRDLCPFTSTGTPGGVAGLIATCDDICADGPPANFISRTLLRRQAGRWERFVPPA